MLEDILEGLIPNEPKLKGKALREYRKKRNLKKKLAKKAKKVTAKNRKRGLKTQN